MSVKAFITGVADTALSDEERAFLRRERPWGLILFARNCAAADQIRELVGEFRSCVGRDDAAVFIDQEGGRVQRLKPPICPLYPTGRTYGRIFEADAEKGRRATYLGARLIASDLTGVGINGDCLPVLDVPSVGAHDVIGDRAYGTNPDIVAELGRIAAEALLDGGVLPVIKHVPGHGRAGVDSHLELPHVCEDKQALAECDFPPFKALSDMPLAMTAHVVFEALDRDAPATVSKRIIEEIIRGELGFDGCLMSDDISMQALSDTIGKRTENLFRAGCDIALHCNGEFAEMTEVAAATPVLAGDAARRAASAMARITHMISADAVAMRAEFEALLDEFAA